MVSPAHSRRALRRRVLRDSTLVPPALPGGEHFTLRPASQTPRTTPPPASPEHSIFCFNKVGDPRLQDLNLAKLDGELRASSRRATTKHQSTSHLAQPSQHPNARVVISRRCTTYLHSGIDWAPHHFDEHRREAVIIITAQR